MAEILDIIDEFEIGTKKFTYIKSNISEKKNGVIQYQSICDGLFLSSNTNVFNTNCDFKLRGIMLDLSRGKSYSEKKIKEIIIKSACLGYNYMTLYIEDLICVNEYPQYGYLRGRLTDNEIENIVRFANSIGYQIVPAIQTLGHLEHLLRWDVSKKIKGTEYVLDVESKETYCFIDKVIQRVAKLFGNTCINIGLDEAFDLGFEKGNVEHLNQKQIFLTHLDKVLEICNRNGFKKIKMWSDMLFSIYSNTDGDALYSLDFFENAQKLNANVELIYWNYWTKNTSEYNRVIKSHKSFSDNISMALAIQTSMNLFYDYSEIESTKAALPALRANGVTNVLYTMWSEDGASCQLDTAIWGMYETMREMFKLTVCESDYQNITGYSYNAMKQICMIKTYGINPMSCLWNDPVFDLYYNSISNDSLNDAYLKIETIPLLKDSNCELYEYYNSLVTYIRLDIKRYLYGIKSEEIKKLLCNYKNIAHYIENMWMKEAKIHGIEDIQKRFILKEYRYQFLNEVENINNEKLEGNIKPRFIQLYSPNKWRF